MDMYEVIKHVLFHPSTQLFVDWNACQTLELMSFHYIQSDFGFTQTGSTLDNGQSAPHSK